MDKPRSLLSIDNLSSNDLPQRNGGGSTQLIKSERSEADIFKSPLELNLWSRSGPVPPDFWR